MRLINLAGLAIPLSILMPSVAGLVCFEDGQPFSEDWKASRVADACEKAKGHYVAGQIFRTCESMGDDKVIFSFHNHQNHGANLEKNICQIRMHDVIGKCGGHDSDNHGGHNSYQVFRYGFDPQESGNGCG